MTLHSYYSSIQLVDCLIDTANIYILKKQLSLAIRGGNRLGQARFRVNRPCLVWPVVCYRLFRLRLVLKA